MYLNYSIHFFGASCKLCCEVGGEGGRGNAAGRPNITAHNNIYQQRSPATFSYSSKNPVHLVVPPMPPALCRYLWDRVMGRTTTHLKTYCSRKSRTFGISNI